MTTSIDNPHAIEFKSDGTEMYVIKPTNNQVQLPV